MLVASPMTLMAGIVDAVGYAQLGSLYLSFMSCAMLTWSLG